MKIKYIMWKKLIRWNIFHNRELVFDTTEQMTNNDLKQ